MEIKCVVLPVAVIVGVPRPRAAAEQRLHNALLVELLFDLLAGQLHHFYLLGLGGSWLRMRIFIWAFPLAYCKENEDVGQGRRACGGAPRRGHGLSWGGGGATVWEPIHARLLIFLVNCLVL